MENVANIQILTNEVKVKNNFISGNEFKINPKFYKRTGKTESGYFTELKVELLNTEENPFPLDLSITITGVFEFNASIKDDEVEKFLNVQAVQVLFPYLRTMVTNITSSSLMAPLILPIVDVTKIFPVV